METPLELNDMSKEELEKLKAQVENALATLEVRRKKDAHDAIKKIADEYGYKLEELVAAPSKRRSDKPAKYINPDNPSQTWTGHGRRPKWFMEKIENGVEEEAMLIAA